MPRTHPLNPSMPKKRKAVYAGSFDPITNGHMYMIHEGARLFDELVVAIGINPDKRYTFTLKERLEFLKKCTKGMRNVTLDHYSNMFLVDYAEQVGAGYILRGLRNPNDFEFERGMRFVNADMNPDVVTIFLVGPREFSEVSSSFVKGLVGPDGWERIVKEYMPSPIYHDFLMRFRSGATKDTHGGLKDMPEQA